jgi:NAD(P)-dependent dehydrogenase (short-subunit alcohol dehydrogenase family)
MSVAVIRHGTVALVFAREGATGVVADGTVEGGEATGALCRAATTDAIFVRCDVAQRSEGEALIHRAVETCGRIDGAHTNTSREGG